ncbi:MAG: hypothetical protein E7311_05245 [Clostridiales bacterium]|nr:hypothetical protein [Clostridiales bacterium]
MLVKGIKLIPIRELEGFNKDEFNVEGFTDCPISLSELDAKIQLELHNLAMQHDEICYALVKLTDGSWNTVTHNLSKGYMGFVLFNACIIEDPTEDSIHAIAHTYKKKEGDDKYHTDVHLAYKKGKVWY